MNVEDLLRRLAPQVLAALVRQYRDFETAEDAVQEALLAAATQWPQHGVPDRPLGWLITVGSRRMIDQLRSERAGRRREERILARTAPADLRAPAADEQPDAADDTLMLLVLHQSAGTALPAGPRGPARRAGRRHRGHRSGLSRWPYALPGLPRWLDLTVVRSAGAAPVTGRLASAEPVPEPGPRHHHADPGSGRSRC